MSKIVFLNDTFVNESDAKISVMDQGFLYGDGIYESFRSVNGTFPQFSKHYERLTESAEALNYEMKYSETELIEILRMLQKKNKITHGYFRLTISRGNGVIGFERSFKNDLTYLILAKEYTGFSEDLYETGIELKVAETRRNAPEAISPKIKSISNLNSLLGKLEAKRLGVKEVIMLNNKDHICEGAASNIFWIKDKWVFTPDTSTGLLEGVTRSTIMDLCERSLDLRVITGEYKLQDLKFADEVFITSTSLEVMPVVKVDNFTINDGKVGAKTKHLRKALHTAMNY